MRNDSVYAQLDDIMETVTKRVKGVVGTQMTAVAKETAQKLKNSSPKMSGDYAKGWTVSKKAGSDVIVHNKTDYQLTHLLENGHVIRNKKGEYGRAPAHVHIAPVEEWAADELPRRIMGDI